MDVVEQVLAHLLQVAADPGDCAEAGVYPVDRLVQGLRGDLAIQLAQGIAMFRRPARNELDDILELALQLLNLALDALALLLRQSVEGFRLHHRAVRNRREGKPGRRSDQGDVLRLRLLAQDRKSTRLNSSH